MAVDGQIRAVADAEEIFGAASQLVVDAEGVVDATIASLGTMYQVAVGVLSLLVLFIIVRYFDLFRYLLLSVLSRKVNRSDIHIFSADIHNIEILSSLAGISLISLVMMRLTIIEELRPLLAPLLPLTPWGIAGVSFVAILAVIFAERLLLYIIGAVSQHNKACNGIWHIKLLHFCVAMIVLAPMLILALLTEGTVAQIALFTSIAICFVALVLFVKETFLLFRAQRFSIFHWILYLCALEFFPLSLLLAPILRG